MSDADFSVDVAIIEITAPIATDTWYRGYAYDITWTTTIPGDTVKIEAYKTGVFNSTVIASTENDGLYNWTVPASLLEGLDYSIVITSLGPHAGIKGNSANFAIGTGTITVIAPNGGESYIRLSTCSVKWDSANAGANVKLDLYKGGIFSSEIVASTENDGSYDWTVPADQTIGDDYKVQVSSVEIPDIADQSDADFSIDAYSVTFVAGENGSIQGELVQTVNYGGDCTPVTAIPNTGYHFVDWTGDYAGSENPLTVTNVTKDMTITANFAINVYTVTFIAGANGTLVGGSPQIQNVQYGADCAPVTAQADLGYHFVDWTGSIWSTENPLTITKVTEDMTVTANFSDTYTVVFLDDGFGSVTGTNPQQVLHGEDCTPVTAVPDANYQFAGWTGDYEGTENPLTVKNVTKEMVIIANFKLTEYTMTMAVSPVNSGSTVPAVGTHTVQHGIAVNISATPVAHCSFVNWTAEPAANVKFGDPTLANTTATLTGAATVTANFAFDQYTLTMAVSPNASGTTTPAVGAHQVQHGVATNVSAVPLAGYSFVNWTAEPVGNVVFGNANLANTTATLTGAATVTANFSIKSYTVKFVAGAGGTVTGELQQTVQHGGNCKPVTAVPNDEFHMFVDWTWTGVPFTANPLTVTNVTADMDITANFKGSEFTVSFTAGANGTIQGQQAQTIAYGGSTSAVTAVPNANYHFSTWSGDYSGTENPLIVTNVSKSMNIVAVFAVDTYKLTVTSGFGSGSYGVAASVSITAYTPPENMIFDKWIGDTEYLEDASSSTTKVTMPAGDVAVTATYRGGSTKPYTLTVVNGTGTGVYREGNIVPVEANDAPEGQIFDQWTGDILYMNSNYSKIAYVTMPSSPSAIRIEANYKPAVSISYLLTVVGGQGGGSYLPGYLAEISAAAAPSGKIFSKWTGDTAYLSNIYSSDAFFTMPEKNASVTAEYADAPAETYELTVTNGKGSGVYQPGELVEVSGQAETLSPKIFEKWTGDIMYLSDPFSEIAVVTMPERGISIKANYNYPATDGYLVAVGSILKLVGTDFNPTVALFDAKAKLKATAVGSKGTATMKTLVSADFLSIQSEWTKKLALIKKSKIPKTQTVLQYLAAYPIAPKEYSVSLKNGALLIEHVSLVPPEIWSVSNTFDQQVESAYAGQKLVIKGMYFGRNKPSVWLEYKPSDKVKALRCKVLNYNMNVSNNFGEIQIVLPSKFKWTGESQHNIVIDNGVGLSSIVFFTK